MKENLQLFHQRRSVRQFTAEPISDEDLRLLLECATRAPTGGKLQPWEFVVVRDPDVKAALVKATYTGYSTDAHEPQAWIGQAPVVVVVCVNPLATCARYGESGAEVALMDGAAATENLLLAACAMGLGACWVAGFRPQEVKRVLGLPQGVRPLALVPIGKPAQCPDPKPRLPLRYVCHRDRYGRPYWQ